MNSSQIYRRRQQAFREQHALQLAQNERARAAIAAADEHATKIRDPRAIAEARPVDTEPDSNERSSSTADR